MNVSLSTEVPRYQLLKQRLLVDYPDLDQETLADSVE